MRVNLRASTHLEAGILYLPC